jgi:hypothetical protein
MEQAMIAALLEKYWLAETSVEEEEQLAAYFRQPVVAPELEPFRHVFAYFASEASVVPNDDLGDRILERIAGLDRAQATPATIRSLPRRNLFGRQVWWAAAAVVVLGISVYLAVPSQHREGGGGSNKTHSNSVADNGRPAGIAVKDTYDDPKLALAAIQKALLAVSTKMTRGKKITQEQMGRMNDSWQTVMRN